MSSSANRCTNLPHEFVPVVADHGVVDVTDTVLDVDSSTVELNDKTGYIHVQVETAAVRLTFNGTTPSATVGFRYEAGVELILSRAEWLASKWIREGSTSAKLQVAQYETR